MELSLQELERFDYEYKKLSFYTDTDFLKNIKPTHLCGFSIRSFYYWKNQERPIPLKVLLLVCKYKKLDKVEITSISLNAGNSIDAPCLDEQFSYFLGFLLGDGCLSISKDKGGKRSYAVRIAIKEKKCLYEMIDLSKLLFGTNVSHCSAKGCYELCVYSKVLVLFLHVVFQIPIGKKYARIQVPKKLKGYNQIKYFLKGLMDTDGNIYLHRKKTCFQLRQKSGRFLNEIYDLFHQVDIPVNKPYYDKANNSWVIWASKTATVDKFINEINALNFDGRVAQLG